MTRGKERPIVGGVTLEERDFGKNEEYCSFSLDIGIEMEFRSGRGEDSLLTQPVIKWLTPSKKKNLETTKVLTSMTKLAATTARRAIMFITRMVLWPMYPGPARDFFNKGIWALFFSFFLFFFFFFFGLM